MARAEDKVFLNYTQGELDRAYDQAAWAPNAAALIASYGTDSATAPPDLPPENAEIWPERGRDFGRLRPRRRPAADPRLHSRRRLALVEQGRRVVAGVHVHG